MSKLTEAMSRAVRRESRPIGFSSTATKTNATMLLLARAPAAGAKDAASSGADAVIGGPIERGANGASGSALWGAEEPVKGREGARALRESGADFLIFADDTTDAAVLLEDDLGFVMRIDFDASDTFLRTVESLQLDALLVPGLEDGGLTVRRTLDLRRLASLARKPLLLPVQPAIDAASLEALRDCGVIGVVVDGAAAAATLRSTIDALPPRRRPKETQGGGSAVMIPAGVGAAHIDEPHEPEPHEE